MRCQCCSVVLQLSLYTCAHTSVHTAPIECSTSSVLYTPLTLPEQCRCHLSSPVSSNSPLSLYPFPLDSKILPGSLTFKPLPVSLFSSTHEWSLLVIGFHFHYSSAYHKIISGSMSHVSCSLEFAGSLQITNSKCLLIPLLLNLSIGFH